MSWMRKNLSTILLFVALIIGLCLLLYPTVSDLYNSIHQSRAILTYNQNVAQIENTKYKEMLIEAREYNQRLAEKKMNWVLSDEELEEYSNVLDVIGTGVMCSIEIPKIKCNLPIYHGTEDDVLQMAIGHIPGTSIPVGGESTHCVISGHRGLPSARLFTDLDKLIVGDIFVLNVLDEVLTYEVDLILIVEPYDISSLAIVEGEDYVTMVTCTPYGINSHRLLVRGHRVDNIEVGSQVRVTADAVQIEPVVVAPVVAVPILFLLLVLLLFTTRDGGRRKSRK